MFGIPAIPVLYLKLGLTALVLAIVAGGYFYVKGLQNSVEKLQTENVLLEDNNRTMSENIKATEEFSNTRDEIGSITHEIRRENIIIRERRQEVINNSVTAGNDREVGPLLEEFFNAE